MPVTLPSNHFKRAIQAGRTQIGLWVVLATPVCAELSAAAGFDWLVIDAEHGPNDVPDVLTQLQAVSAHATSAVVRVPIGDSTLVKRYLDIGAQTLLVPMVETAEQAEMLVASSRYAPAGFRGIATMTRAAGWGRVSDYLARARDEICLIPQIETVTALENLDAIAAVDGVDAIFIGPADLAASMGHPGQAGHPQVVARVEDAIARIRAAGKPAGILTLDETLARRYLELGCTFVAVGVDAILLSRAADALRGRFLGGTAAPAGSGY